MKNGRSKPKQQCEFRTTRRADVAKRNRRNISNLAAGEPDKAPGNAQILGTVRRHLQRAADAASGLDHLQFEDPGKALKLAAKIKDAIEWAEKLKA